MSDININMLGGCCPVQAEGTIDGKPFYFRARWDKWSMSIGGSDVVGNPDWYYQQAYGEDGFSAGLMSEVEALTFINESAKLYIKDKNEMNNNYYLNIIAAQKIEIAALKQELDKPAFSIPVDYEAIDNLVASELRSVALNLCEYIMQGGVDAEDSLDTLEGVLTTLRYYSTTSEFNAFLNKLPPEVLDKVQFEDNAIGENLLELGTKTYLAMAELGFISFETLINLAKVQLRTIASK